jgi:hypothetical protein
MADESRTESELHNAAEKLGHAGGLRGGPARARTLSAQERSSIASKAAKARWSKEKLSQTAPGQKLKANPHLRRRKRGKGKKK